MVEILRSKNSATRFQILVDIAARQPNIQQKHVARSLGLTPQAVSDYIKQLLKEGLLSSEGRSRYKVSAECVDWIIEQLKEVQEYFKLVEKVVSNIKVTAAVASCNLSKGQNVGVVMRGGLLTATSDLNVEARGLAVSDAVEGDSVGITNIHGIISLDIGEVTILEVANIQKGGSGNVELDQLQDVIEGKSPIVYLGIEALTCLKRIGIQPDCNYGAKEVIIEAAHSGLSPVIVCVDYEIPMLIKRLEEAGIKHKLLDLRLV